MSEQVIGQVGVSDDELVSVEVPVGEQLRLAREAQGLELVDIAHTLKLGPRQVEALENGDWQGLPGQTFIRGFVRNYARLVQIDQAPLMAQLTNVLEKPEDNLTIQAAEAASMPTQNAPISRRDRVVVLFGVGLVAVAALAYFLMPRDLSLVRDNVQNLLDSLAHKEVPDTAPAITAEKDPVFPPGQTQQQVLYPQALASADAPPPAAPAPAVPPTPSVAATEPTATTSAVVPGKLEAGPVATVSSAPQMRFLFEKESWIEVRDRDNKVIFSQRLPAGTEQTLSGQGPLSLTIGYAPGVRLFWHGQAVDLAPHTRGDVAKLVLE